MYYVLDGATYIDVAGQPCPYNDAFQLLLVSPPVGPAEKFLIDQEFVSYCSFTNFSATDFALRERFLNTLFEKESPRYQIGLLTLQSCSVVIL